MARARPRGVVWWWRPAWSILLDPDRIDPIALSAPREQPRFNLKEITSLVDGSATDIAAALQLALASFPPNSSKRIVLMSDGNENRGSAASLAALARASGVEIDVIALGEGQRQENEVLLERVEAPTHVERGAPLPLKVWVRSFSTAWSLQWYAGGCHFVCR